MTPEQHEQLEAICKTFLAQRNTNLVFLTGAGLSAESGLPTFRGSDGYWTMGSVNYTPQEVATLAFWEHQPWVVWKLTRHLLHAIQKNDPNIGHDSIARIDRILGDRCRVITQNVDAYHQAAGNDPDRVYEIHGHAFQVRCGEDCQYPPKLLPLPASVASPEPELDMSSADLRCQNCGGFLRPHALFFDELYNDELYYLRKSLNAVRKAGLLVIVGTAGATTLPQEIVETAYEKGAFIVDINPDRDPFAEKAEERGLYLPYKAGEVLPVLALLLA